MKVEIYLLLSTFITLSYQISTPESPDYVGGVVEFAPELLSVPVEERVRRHTQAYLDFIASEEAKEVDILVFPEATLNRRNYATFVPKADAQIAPCDDTTDTYAYYLRDISCAARDNNKYVVINLSEKYQCTQEEQDELNDPRPCSRNGISYYNTNVVFDRTGTVISTYRKFNLFGEFGVNTTLVPDISTFTTDFGVTFGHFICFDILFEQPTMELVRRGIQNFVYPAMWFSELPYLTSVQAQYMWAWENNVNFLGAGANNPRSGSTGSSIIAGRKGVITEVMAGSSMRRLLVARVPKDLTVTTPYTHDPVAVKYTETEMLNLTLMRENLDIYATKLVDLSQGLITDNLCYGDLCCDFELDFTFDDSLVTEGSDYYRYYMGVFDGVRTYRNVATGGVINCGIFACTTNELSSCGTRFDASVNVVPAVTFNKLKIKGAFPSGPHIEMNPNAVNNFILPMDFNEFEYKESAETIDDGQTVRDIELELDVPHNDIRAFAIYGRNFEKDGQDVSTTIPESAAPTQEEIPGKILDIDLEIIPDILEISLKL